MGCVAVCHHSTSGVETVADRVEEASVRHRRPCRAAGHDDVLVRMASWMPCVWRACTPTLFGRSRMHAPSLCAGATGPRIAPVDYPHHGTRARLCYSTSHNSAIPSSHPDPLQG